MTGKTKAEQAKPAPKEQPRVAVAPTTPSVGSAPGDVINKLVDFGANRVSLINRSIAPSKSSRQVTQEGGKYVGRDYYVEPSSLHVEASPADPSSPFKYIGKVRYREGFYEIRANSREEALKGEGSVIQQRNMCELIQYKNNKWLEKPSGLKMTQKREKAFSFFPFLTTQVRQINFEKTAQEEYKNFVFPS